MSSTIAIGLTGEPGLKGRRGPQGDKGSNGLPGPIGAKGATGLKGVKGDKEERNAGTVYVRWGHDQCPSTTQLVYSGRAGGSNWNQGGGGSNPQCLPLDPDFLVPIGGFEYRAEIFGAIYEAAHTSSTSPAYNRHFRGAPCAVCYVTQRTTVFMVPGKYTCPSGWTREYYGYLMAEHRTHGRSQYTCVDNALKTGSKLSNGMVFHFVEGRCGSLPCPPYDNSKELSCAVCTK